MPMGVEEEIPRLITPETKVSLRFGVPLLGELGMIAGR